MKIEYTEPPVHDNGYAVLFNLVYRAEFKFSDVNAAEHIEFYHKVQEWINENGFELQCTIQAPTAPHPAILHHPEHLIMRVFIYEDIATAIAFKLKWG